MIIASWSVLNISESLMRQAYYKLAKGAREFYKERVKGQVARVRYSTTGDALKRL
jgi:hypothetical protein